MMARNMLKSTDPRLFSEEAKAAFEGLRVNPKKKTVLEINMEKMEPYVLSSTFLLDTLPRSAIMRSTTRISEFLKPLAP
jgi:hypothetical protein